MGRATRTFITLSIILALGVGVAYLVYHMYSQAPRQADLPNGFQRPGTDVDNLVKRLKALDDARDTLATNPDEGCDKLRRIAKELAGTADAGEAELILAQTLADAVKARRAVELLDQCLREVDQGRALPLPVLAHARRLLDPSEAGHSSDPARQDAAETDKLLQAILDEPANPRDRLQKARQRVADSPPAKLRVDPEQAQAEAIALFGRSIDDPKAGRRASRALLMRAGLLMDVDEAAARADLRRVVRQHERSAPILYARAGLVLADIHLRRGQHLEAIRILGPISLASIPQKAAADRALRQAIHAHVAGLAAKGDWNEVVTWSGDMIAKYPELPGLRNVLRYRQAVAHRKLGHLATARTIVERLVRDLPAALLAKEVDVEAELAAIAAAEAAQGIRRTRAAFLDATRTGGETRAHVEGTLAADTTWPQANGPLVLTAPVVVQPGATLTIQPGARIEFLQGARLVVQGALVAAGTPQAPIRFTSAVRRPDARTAFDGEGIAFAKARPGRESRVEHCVLEHQRVALACAGGTLVLRHCTFRRSGKAALLATDDATLTVEDCTFENNDGTAVNAKNTTATIRRCVVHANGRDGIRLEGPVRSTIEASRIAANGRHGIVCESDLKAAIHNNRIEGNQGHGIYCNKFVQAVIKGNHIRNNGGKPKEGNDGVRCERQSDCEIVGNLIEGNAKSGIALDGCKGSIKDNYIRQNKSYGVNCESSAAPLIEGNVLRGNVSDGSGVGVAAADGSQPIVTRNTIGYHDPCWISNTGTSDLDAPENYFELPARRPPELTGDELIEKYLFDRLDMKALGKINWKPRLPSPPPPPALPKLTNVP